MEIPNSMNILHITGYYNKNVSYQENLLPKGERKHKNNVYIITSNMKPSYGLGAINYYDCNVECDGGIPIIRLKTRLLLKKSWPIIYVPLKLIRRINPDVIFLHDVNPYTIQILLMSKIGLLKGVKLFFDCHSEVGKDNINFAIQKYNWFMKYFFKFFGGNISKYYGVAPECCEFIQQVYQVPAEKIKLLPLPSIKNLLSCSEVNNIKKQYGLAFDKTILLHSGKLPGNKLTNVVLEALSRLSVADYQLVITGSIEDTFRMKYSHLLKQSNVLILGWLEPNELRDIISASDILVQPGSLSNTFIDALCCGTAIILNDTSQGRYLTKGRNGELLKDNLSIDELVILITKVSSNLEYYNLNAQEIADNFDYKTLARITLNDYIS